MPSNNNHTECKYSNTIEKKSRLKAFSISLIVILAFILISAYFATSIYQKNESLLRFKTGSLNYLEVLKEPPAQPTKKFLDMNGKEIGFANFRGKYLLVNIWATWCGPCIEEMPSLANLREQYKNKNIEIIAISVDKQDKGEYAKSRLLQLSGGKMDFYHDPTMGIAFPLRAQGFPTTIIYNKNGVEVARVSGVANWQSTEAKTLIDEIISNN